MTDEAVRKPVLSTELKLRILSAVVLAVLVVVMTWIGGQTFKLLWIVASLAIFIEYSRITGEAFGFAKRAAAFGFLILSMIAWFIQDYTSALMIFALGVATLLVWELIISRSAWAAGALVYSGMPFFAMTQLRGDTYEGFILILFLFGCVWGADVFAYFFGKTIGGPKLAPKISPKKTWAGFIGSLIGAAAISWAVVWFGGYKAGWAFFAVMMLLAVGSQIGDLVESVIKRKFGVKDSGTIIPGHGGVLDRRDGLIFAGIILWLVLVFWEYTPTIQPDLAKRFFEAFLLP